MGAHGRAHGNLKCQDTGTNLDGAMCDLGLLGFKATVELSTKNDQNLFDPQIKSGGPPTLCDRLPLVIPAFAWSALKVGAHA